MRSVFIIFIILIFLVPSCKDDTTGIHIHQEELPAAKGYTPPPDSVEPPQIIPVGTPNVIKAGQPRIVSIGLTPGETGGINPIQVYTSENGLALDGIAFGQKSSICDSKGNLWFGTTGGGASRYDGKTFTNFTTIYGVSNNFVTTILEDRLGNLWFGTAGGGASKYDGKSFTKLTTRDGLIHDIIYSIMEDRAGSLWFGTSEGLSRYDGNRMDTLAPGVKSVTNFTAEQGLPTAVIRAIVEDKKGNIWIATYGNGIYKYDPSHTADKKNPRLFINYTTRDGLAGNVASNILEDKKGNLWFSTEDGGVSKYDGTDLPDGKPAFTNFTTKDGLAHNTVFTITEDRTGNLWFGTLGGGASKYNGHSFTTFNTARGLSNNNVWGLTEDKAGNIWFGTYGGGVNKYDCKYITHYNTTLGLGSNYVFTTTEDKDGNLWFGTVGGGISKYDGRSFTTFTKAQGLGADLVWCSLQDKSGNLWFGSDGGGVSKYDGKSFTNYGKAQGLVYNEIRYILEDKKGDLWFASQGGGVSRYDGKTFINYTVKQGLPGNLINTIMEDKKGNLWFGSQGRGVSKFDGTSFTTFTTADGLTDNFVNAILEDKKGNFWFGTTGGGISRYDGKSFINYTERQGLPDNCVTQLMLDSLQHLLIGTNKGLTVLTSFAPDLTIDDVEKTTSPATPISPVNELSNQWLQNYFPVFKIYNTSTGFPIKDVNGGQNCMYMDRKGILWLGTGSDKTALVRFDYNSLSKDTNHLTPQVVIQGIKIHEETMCWYNLTANKYDSLTISQQEIASAGKALLPLERDSARIKFSGIQFDSITPFYPLPVNLVLPYKHNRISFEFAAIEPARPYLIKYQYFLEGYDQEWSSLKEKTDVSYTNIYEGTYTFRLRARNADGIWSNTVEYPFRVLPPWWRSWWMYAVYVILTAALIVLIVWLNGWRLRQKAKALTIEVRKATLEIKRQQEVLKEQQVRELELVAIRAQMNPHFLFNVLSSIQMLINKKDVLSANNALGKFGKLMRLILENSEKQSIFLADEIEMLKLYVDLESMLLSFNFNLSIDPELDTENISIPTMIIQPYVENAIKHGLSNLDSNRQLNIGFQMQEHILRCTIYDNGIGRKMSEEIKSKHSKHKSMGTRLAYDRLKIINKQVISNVEVVIKDLVDEQDVACGTLVEMSLPAGGE